MGWRSSRWSIKSRRKPGDSPDGLWLHRVCRQALRLRIHDYLLKPAPPAQVVNSVKKGLARREAPENAGGSSTADVDEGMAEFSSKMAHIDLSRTTGPQKRPDHSSDARRGATTARTDRKPGTGLFAPRIGLAYAGIRYIAARSSRDLRPLVSRLRHKLETFPSLSDRIVSVAAPAICMRLKSKVDGRIS